MAEGPILPRRRLGNELRRLRGIQTLEDVSKATLISTSKLSRLENGQGAPQQRDVRDLISYYEVDRADADRFRRWATEGRKRAWWRDYSDNVAAAPADEYLDYESGASTIRYYAPLIIPGLLQTQEYARTIIRTMPPAKSDEEAAKLLELRMRRQQILSAPDNVPTVNVIFDEAALHRTLGMDTSTAIGQLEHLRDVSKRRNITVTVIPFEGGPHPGLLGMFTVFQFTDNIDRDVVSQENYSGDRFLEEDTSVLAYLRLFDSLTQRALEPQETRSRIDSLLDRLDPAHEGLRQ